MYNNIKIFVLLSILSVWSCSVSEDYSLGNLTPPSNVVLEADLVGKTADLPNGDGSGDVAFTIKADNALSYRIDYDASDALSLVNLPTGKITKKYTKLGTNTYVVTAVVFGAGGTSTTVTKEVTVLSNFIPDPTIINNLTGGSSKTWVVDASVAGHFGVGEWNDKVSTPAWWSANINEKVGCCNCFYTSTFKFSKTASGYTLDVATPDGAFTKTGALAGGLPGIPGSGDEGCYAYSGGSSAFSFIPSSTGVAAAAPSTKTAILLSGSNTYIGYGALKKEYEIMVISPTYMYLRAQGTETGNAWYIKLKSL